MGRAGIPLELALASHDYNSMPGVVVPYILAGPDQVVTVFAAPVQPIQKGNTQAVVVFAE